MAEEKETLIVTLEREKSNYMAVSTEFNDGKSGPKKNNEKENLQVSHMQNVLNHFGKRGWTFEKISPDEKTLQFCRAKQRFISRLFERKAIRHRIRNIYKNKETQLFQVGADLPFGEGLMGKDLYFNSIREVIGYISKKYGYIFLFQASKEKLAEESIKLYFYEQ